MKKANPAQVLSGFMWKHELPKKAVTISAEEGAKFDQQTVLEYLLEFQTWLHENPNLREPDVVNIETNTGNIQM